MQSTLISALSLGLCLVVLGPAQAAVIVTPDPNLPGNDSISGVYTLVLFPDFSNGNYPTVFVEKSLDVADPVGFSISYLASDFPDATGLTVFRLVERVTNNSAFAWTDFHVEIDKGQQGFQGFPASIPDTVIVTGNDPNVVSTDAPGVGVLTTTSTTVDVAFASPIAPGSSFGLFMVFDPPVNDSPVHVMEYPTFQTPEPSGFALAGLGFSILAACERRKRKTLPQLFS